MDEKWTGNTNPTTKDLTNPNTGGKLPITSGTPQ
jgi:hypothetical protein